MSKAARSIAKVSSLCMAMAAAATMLAGPVSATTNDSAAALEFACNSAHSLCNLTYGSGARVDYIEAQKGGALANSYGFFEVFARNNYKKTDITTRANIRQIEIYRTFAQGELICLRYFQYVNGSFAQKGGNVCTSIPIS